MAIKNNTYQKLRTGNCKPINRQTSIILSHKPLSEKDEKLNEIEKIGSIENPFNRSTFRKKNIVNKNGISYHSKTIKENTSTSNCNTSKKSHHSKIRDMNGIKFSELEMKNISSTVKILNYSVPKNVKYVDLLNDCLKQFNTPNSNKIAIFINLNKIGYKYSWTIETNLEFFKFYKHLYENMWKILFIKETPIIPFKFNPQLYRSIHTHKR